MTSINVTTASAAGPTLTIAEDFLAKGVAQVIVAIKPTEGAGTAGTSTGRRSRGPRGGADLESVAASLGRYFEKSELSQDVALTTAARGARPARATRGGRRARGHTHEIPSSSTSQAPAGRLFKNLGLMLGTVTPDGLRSLQ